MHLFNSKKTKITIVDPIKFFKLQTRIHYKSLKSCWKKGEYTSLKNVDLILPCDHKSPPKCCALFRLKAMLLYLVVLRVFFFWNALKSPPKNVERLSWYWKWIRVRQIYIFLCFRRFVIIRVPKMRPPYSNHIICRPSVCLFCPCVQISLCCDNWISF